MTTPNDNQHKIITTHLINNGEYHLLLKYLVDNTLALVDKQINKVREVVLVKHVLCMIQEHANIVVSLYRVITGYDNENSKQ